MEINLAGSEATSSSNRLRVVIILAVVVLVGIGGTLSAQSVYVPVGHESYDFLKRMEARELLADYKDAALPQGGNGSG